MKLWKKVVIAIVGILVFALLMLLIFIWYVGSSVFSRTPAGEFTPSPPDPMAMARITSIAQVAAAEISMANANSGTSRIELGQAEVNALLHIICSYVNIRIRTMAIGEQQGSMRWTKDDFVAAEFDGEKIHLTFSKWVDFRNPWGRFLNTSVVMTPAIIAGEVEFDIHRVAVGSMGVPGGVMTSDVEMFLGGDADIKDAMDSTYLEMIENLWVEDDKIIVEYHLWKAQRALGPYLQFVTDPMMMMELMNELMRMSK